MSQVVTVPIPFSHEHIKGVLITALVQGIYYWCDQVKRSDDNGLKKEYYDLPLTPGSHWKLHETEECQWHTLDLDRIVKGIVLMAEKYPQHFKNFVDDGGDCETADVFVQCCLFGEIKYG